MGVQSGWTILTAVAVRLLCSIAQARIVANGEITIVITARMSVLCVVKTSPRLRPRQLMKLGIGASTTGVALVNPAIVQTIKLASVNAPIFCRHQIALPAQHWLMKQSTGAIIIGVDLVKIATVQTTSTASMNARSICRHRIAECL